MVVHRDPDLNQGSHGCMIVAFITELSHASHFSGETHPIQENQIHENETEFRPRNSTVI